MFPLCNECFDRLSQQDILGYCNRLYANWSAQSHEPPWSDIEDQIKVSIQKMKEEGDADDN